MSFLETNIPVLKMCFLKTKRIYVSLTLNEVYENKDSLTLNELYRKLRLYVSLTLCTLWKLRIYVSLTLNMLYGPCEHIFSYL